MTKDESKRLQDMTDEDIDYSDIPELTDEELERFRPARDYLKDIARRNRAAMARIICDEEEGRDLAIAAAEALAARALVALALGAACAPTARVSAATRIRGLKFIV